MTATDKALTRFLHVLCVLLPCTSPLFSLFQICFATDGKFAASFFLFIFFFNCCKFNVLIFLSPTLAAKFKNNKLL